MNIRTAIAGLAFLGMIGLVTSNAGACGESKSKSACSGMTSKSGCAKSSKMSCGASKTGAKACSMVPEKCEKMMRERYESHGWLGIEMNNEGPQPVVTRVVQNSPAAAAGFRAGDTLTSVNGIGFGPASESALQEFMTNGFKVGDTVVYTVKRDGEMVSLDATLARIDGEVLDQMIASHLANSHMAGQKTEKLD